MHGSPGDTDTTTWTVGSSENGTVIPHTYVPAWSSLRLSKVTVKVRFAGWSLMDTWPRITSLSGSLVSTVFHGNKHGALHQYLLLSLYFSAYRHSTLKDPPTTPVTLLGPLRDKQPGKHNRVWLFTRWAWVRGTLGSPPSVPPSHASHLPSARESFPVHAVTPKI